MNLAIAGVSMSHGHNSSLFTVLYLVRAQCTLVYFFKTWWLGSRVLDMRSKGCWFKVHWRHFIVSLSKTFYPLLRTGSTQEDREVS